MKRLAKFNLSLNEDKTKLVSFSKVQTRKGIKQGAFDFLGFTFYLGRSRKGKRGTQGQNERQTIAFKIDQRKSLGPSSQKTGRACPIYGKSSKQSWRVTSATMACLSMPSSWRDSCIKRPAFCSNGVYILDDTSSSI